MAFPTTFSGWISYVRDWIGADEYSDAQIGQFLDLAHVRLNTDLMTFPMEKAITLTVPVVGSEQPIDLAMHIPDFGKIRLVVVKGIGPLEVAAFNEYVSKVEDLTNTCVRPEIYTITTGQLYIWPWLGDNDVADIYYYEKVPSLGAALDTNTFSLHHPDLLLYASVLEASPYMVEDERIPVWEGKYSIGVVSANNASTKIKFGSTPLLRKITGMS